MRYTSVLLAMMMPLTAFAEPFFFSTGAPGNQIAAASRPAAAGKIEIEAADDFLLPLQTTLTSATFTGLLPSGAAANSISQVVVEIYRVFPIDSVNPPPAGVPTRANSPADVAFASRDSAANSLTFEFTILSSSFAALNSVLNGIHPAPAQTTGGEGVVSGEEGRFTVNFAPAITLPAGQYFFVAQAGLSSGEFYWLSGSRPIVSPGTPFVPDLQAWIRNADLEPNWLRIGTDIVGTGSFNLAFTLTGEDDRIFAGGFEF